MPEYDRQLPDHFLVSLALLEIPFHFFKGGYHRRLVHHPLDHAEVILLDSLDLLLVAEVAVEVSLARLRLCVFLRPVVSID